MGGTSMIHDPYLQAINDAPTPEAALEAMGTYAEHGQPPRPDHAPSRSATTSASRVRDALEVAHAVRAALPHIDPSIRPAAAQGAIALAWPAQELTVVATQRRAYELGDKAFLAGIYNERALGIRFAGFAQAALLGALDQAITAGDTERIGALEVDLAYACDRAADAIAVAEQEIAAARAVPA